MTPFETAVLAVLQGLEPGDVVTYGDVAAEAGFPGAARAVGGVLRRVELPLPWWRVVTSSGRLVPGHEREQARRLRAEGVAVTSARVGKIPRPRRQASGPAGAEASRCAWAEPGRASPAMVDYHDHEWGVPSRDDRHLFELLVLESAQAGLSWSTVLAKRAGYRAAFSGFDPAEVATFGPDQVSQLLEDTSIIRNRAKIEAAIGNARVVTSMHDRQERLADLIWSVVDGVPRTNVWSEPAEVPVATEEARELVRALRRAGMRHVGPTTCYSLMQAAGLVNDHLVSCYRWAELSSRRAAARLVGSGVDVTTCRSRVVRVRAT